MSYEWTGRTHETPEPKVLVDIYQWEYVEGRIHGRDEHGGVITSSAIINRSDIMGLAETDKIIYVLKGPPRRFWQSRV